MRRGRAFESQRTRTLAGSVTRRCTLASLVTTSLLACIAGAARAQAIPSDPFYERPWNHVSMQGKLYFNTERPAGLFEYDPTPRAGHPRGRVRVLNFDPPMTHYGHLELPRQLANAHYSVVRWLVKPE